MAARDAARAAARGVVCVVPVQVDVEVGFRVDVVGRGRGRGGEGVGGDEVGREDEFDAFVFGGSEKVFDVFGAIYVEKGLSDLRKCGVTGQITALKLGE